MREEVQEGGRVRVFVINGDENGHDGEKWEWGDTCEMGIGGKRDLVSVLS